MALLDQLRSLGERLGILVVNVPADGAQGSTERKVETRKVTVEDLKGTIEEEEVRALADLPAELSVPFDKVFEAAGVAPPSHGWTADRLQQLLLTEQYRGMERDAVKKAVLGLLAAEQADVQDVVKDAVARDQAIDAYADFVKKKMESRHLARERKISAVDKQIADLERQRSELRHEIAEDEKRLKTWGKKKREFERRLAWTVSHLLKEPVVSIDPRPKE